MSTYNYKLVDAGLQNINFSDLITYKSVDIMTTQNSERVYACIKNNLSGLC